MFETETLYLTLTIKYNYMWVSYRCSGFLPQTKDMLLMCTEDFRSAIGLNARVNVILSVPCDTPIVSWDCVQPPVNLDKGVWSSCVDVTSETIYTCSV